jgi:hypothetical protein
MATDIVSGLFGITPESYQQQQDLMAQQRAMEYAQMTPTQQSQYGMFLGGQRLGGAIGQALGAQDPQLQKISAINALGRQFDLTNPDSMIMASKTIQQLYPDVALQLNSKAQELKLAQLKVKKDELSVQQEENLRKELAALGPNATNDQIMSVVVQYGTPDKVLAALQSSADKQAQREANAQLQKDRIDTQKQIAQDRIDAQIAAARERGATQKEIAQMQIDGRNQIAQMTLALKQQTIDEKKQKENEVKAGVVSSFDSAIDTLDTIASHPGKKSAVGTTGKIASLIPGTDAAGFASQLQTFKAQVFLPQVQSLKGMGALSDAEGKNLTAAIGALDQNMSQSEFDSQLVKIKNSLTQARARAAASLPKQMMPEPPAPAMPAVQAGGGQTSKGTKYQIVNP